MASRQTQSSPCWRLRFAVSFVLGAITVAPQASDEIHCQAAITKIYGQFIACLHEAVANRLLQTPPWVAQGPFANECEQQFEYRHSQAMRRWNYACSGYHDAPTTADFFGIPAAAQPQSVQVAQQQLSQLVRVGQRSVTSSSLVVTGIPPTPIVNELIFFNNCTTDLKLMSDQSLLNGVKLEPQGTQTFQLASLNQAGANMIQVAPVTSNEQCAAVACSDWTAIQAAGQRMGAMWELPNLTYAAYCQPTNAAVRQCTDDHNTPCCGSKMNLDRTFGTLFEITPAAYGNQDFVDISTNYGSGSYSPPPLCDANGDNADNCVTDTANIFFNVPIQVDMGQQCDCDSLSTRQTLSCTDVSCTDAYQYPTDTKQCSCAINTNRGYTVTYCPSGSPLPDISGD